MKGRFTLGGEEWLALPELELPAIKARVNARARASTLYAFQIEPFGPRSAPIVRFGVRPIPGRKEFEVYTSARVVGRRQVRLSTGRRETCFVVQTTIAMGGRSWPVEVTLVSEPSDDHRLVLGRNALKPRMVLDTSVAFQQPRLSYALYRQAASAAPAQRALRIALLSSTPNTTSNQNLRLAAELAGHVLEPIDPASCMLFVDAAEPSVIVDGAALPHYDAVIPRLDATSSTAAISVIRQLELLGSYAVNTPRASRAALDPLLQHQLLSAARIAVLPAALAHGRENAMELCELIGGPPVTAVCLRALDQSAGVLARTRQSLETVLSAIGGSDDIFLLCKVPAGADADDMVSCIVIGGRLRAAVHNASPSHTPNRRRQRLSPRRAKLTREERWLVQKAAGALGLGLARIDLVRTPDGPSVIALDATPVLAGFEKISRVNLASKVISLVEQRVRSVVRRPAAGTVAPRFAETGQGKRH